MDNISLSDIRAVTENDNWGGQNGSWWILILFILLGGGGYGWNNNREIATVGDVERGFYQQTNEGMLRAISNGICDSAYALNNAIKDGSYANTVAVKDARFDIADRITNAHYNTDAGVAALAAQQAQCCCESKTLALENKYDIVNAIHGEGEKTRALIQEDKIEALQGKIASLELQNALCGVVRYPNSTAYSAGCNPYFSGYNGTVF